MNKARRVRVCDRIASVLAAASLLLLSIVAGSAWGQDRAGPQGPPRDAGRANDPNFDGPQGARLEAQIGRLREALSAAEDRLHALTQRDGEGGRSEAGRGPGPRDGAAPQDRFDRGAWQELGNRMDDAPRMARRDDGRGSPDGSGRGPEGMNARGGRPFARGGFGPGPGPHGPPLAGRDVRRPGQPVFRREPPPLARESFGPRDGQPDLARRDERGGPPPRDGLRDGPRFAGPDRDGRQGPLADRGFPGRGPDGMRGPDGARRGPDGMGGGPDGMRRGPDGMRGGPRGFGGFAGRPMRGGPDFAGRPFGPRAGMEGGPRDGRDGPSRDGLGRDGTARDGAGRDGGMPNIVARLEQIERRLDAIIREISDERREPPAGGPPRR